MVVRHLLLEYIRLDASSSCKARKFIGDQSDLTDKSIIRHIGLLHVQYLIRS